jgi:hypothetical protein
VGGGRVESSLAAAWALEIRDMPCDETRLRLVVSRPRLGPAGGGFTGPGTGSRTSPSSQQPTEVPRGFGTSRVLALHARSYGSWRDLDPTGSRLAAWGDGT